MEASDGQIERLIDVLARIHLEIHGLRSDLRSDLEEIAIRVSAGIGH